MAKLIYVGFPSPLTKISCSEVESGEDVEVQQVSRGICQDISAIPTKKGKYVISLEFDYDPAVLANISNLSLSGTKQAKDEVPPADINSFEMNIPGMNVTPNADGTISFQLPKDDGSFTEVSANIPGMIVKKNEDGSVSFSMPGQESQTTTTLISSPVPQKQQRTSTTKTTTTITKTTIPGSASTTTTTIGQFSVPRTQNISIKLPCPKHHHSILKTACTDPNGAAVPVSCTIISDELVGLEFSPRSGNGIYSLNLMIGDKTFPGCPIEMEVRGL